MKRLITTLAVSFAAVGGLSGCYHDMNSKKDTPSDITVHPEAGLVIETKHGLTFMADFNANSFCKIAVHNHGQASAVSYQTCQDFEDIKSPADSTKVAYLRQFLPQ
jgi:hypothetical protein